MTCKSLNFTIFSTFTSTKGKRYSLLPGVKERRLNQIGSKAWRN